MNAIIATQTYKGEKSSRLFLKEGRTKTKNFIKEMTGLGWEIQHFEVDSCMIETLQLKFSIDRR